MNWLSFVNAIVGVLLILISGAGMFRDHTSAVAVGIAGLIVLGLGAIRWITGFSRFSGYRGPAALPH